MKFNSINEIQRALKLARVNKANRRTYTVLFKKAVIEYAHAHKLVLCNFAVSLSVNSNMLYRWEDQFNAGLYTMEGVYSVSPKNLKVNSHIVLMLQGKIMEIERDIKGTEAALDVTAYAASVGVEITVKGAL